METKLPPRADFLDILFERRNKAYGAYMLRREYPLHLRRGLMGSFMLAGLFALALHLGLSETGQDRKLPVFDIVPVELMELHPSNLEEKPLKPRPPAASVRPAVRDLVPVVVPDEVQIESRVPTVEERLEADAGLVDAMGDPAAGAQQGSPQEAGTVATGEVSGPAEPSVYAFEAVEKPAQFPGGERALRRFLEQHLEVPEGEGPDLTRVLVRFVVAADGSIGAFSLEKSGGKRYDDEVLRVLGKMPRWVPARQHQRNVAMYFVLPVLFQAH